MTAAATRVLFDEPGPRARARTRIATVVGLLLVAGLVALALYQFYKNGQLGRSRWLAFAQPAYLRFLSRVLMRHPAMLREALALAAKGYHLRTMTEQITAVEHVKQYLARELAQLQADLARCAHEGNTRLHAYVQEVMAQIRREYGTIHADFRHDVDEALNAFMRALDPSLQALHLPMPIRLS